jgi:hypothetical protein
VKGFGACWYVEGGREVKEVRIGRVGVGSGPIGRAGGAPRDDVRGPYEVPYAGGGTVFA